MNAMRALWSGSRQAAFACARKTASPLFRRLTNPHPSRSKPARLCLTGGLVLSGTLFGLSQAQCLPSSQGTDGADAGSSLSSGWLYGVAAGAAAAGAYYLYLRDDVAATEARLKRWHFAWDVNNPTRAGFHMKEVHPALEKYLPLLLDDGVSAMHFPKRILFTLCGKTVDMPYLASLGHKVVGCDGIRRAADELIAENGMTVTASEHRDGFEILDLSLSGDKGRVGMRFAVGDYFRMAPSTAGTFECCFDRGALVAVDPALRQQYVQRLTGLLDKGARVLLVATEHDPMLNKKSGQGGPPFDLPEGEVRALFGERFDVQLLERENLFEKEPWWKERGCTYFFQAVYILTKRT